MKSRRIPYCVDLEKTLNKNNILLYKNAKFSLLYRLVNRALRPTKEQWEPGKLSFTKEEIKNINGIKSDIIWDRIIEDINSAE
jgi:hypothetical protein